MKTTFWLNFAVVASNVLRVLGASVLVQTVLALCGVPITWWVGGLSAVPGMLISKCLRSLFILEWKKREGTNE